MEINTRDFGTITVEKDSIFNFPEGVYGFEEDTCFALFVRTFEDVPFLYLQSVENVTPCFLVFEPKDFFPDYSPKLNKEDLDACGVKSHDELTFLLIANVPESIEEMSLNMKSPVVLNGKSKIGRQIILQNSDYDVRYQPFISPKGKGGN